MIDFLKNNIQKLSQIFFGEDVRFQAFDHKTFNFVFSDELGRAGILSAFQIVIAGIVKMLP
ncbi:MAG: hypothetical protein ACOY3K_00830 [Candidatus Omnitrophota bacterium]